MPAAARAGTLSAAERSYPRSEVRVSSLECQAAMAPERPRGATLRLRSGAAADRSYPASEVTVYMYVCIYIYIHTHTHIHYFFMHSFVNGHLDCFHVLDILNSAVVNIGVNVYF